MNKETIGNLHRKKLSEIVLKEKKIADIKNKIVNLSNKKDYSRIDQIEQIRLENEINDIKNLRTSYLLKNAILLFLHTENQAKNINKNFVYGVDILKNKKNDKIDHNSYYKRYKYNIFPEELCYSENNINEDNYCYTYKKFKVFNIDEAISTCLSCGISINVSTNPEKPSIKPAENDYKRYTHFCDCLANIQGKESVKVSEEVINTIIREIVHEKMENSLEKLIEADIKRYLKKHRKLRYYNHATQILYRITNIPPLQMTPIMEEKLKIMFLQIQEPFEIFKGKNRSNFFSYSYIIYKFCQLLEYNEFLPKLKLYKDRLKLYEHDKIWKKICEHLGGESADWKFINS